MSTSVKYMFFLALLVAYMATIAASYFDAAKKAPSSLCSVASIGGTSEKAHRFESHTLFLRTGMRYSKTRHHVRSDEFVSSSSVLNVTEPFTYNTMLRLVSRVQSPILFSKPRDPPTV